VLFALFFGDNHVIKDARNDPRVSTNEAYRFWRGLIFPGGSADPAVDRLHAGLTHWDGLVANSVIPVMDRTENYDPGAVDFDAGLALLRRQMSTLMPSAADEDRLLLRDYVEYVDALMAANAEVRELR
jgi:hypothetical protein